jgi:hypothetical protein
LWDRLLVGGDLRTTFLEAAFEQERTRWSRDIIQKSFRNTGLYPFCESTTRRLAETNLAASPDEVYGVKALATEAAIQVVEDTSVRTEDDRKSTIRGKIRTPKGGQVMSAHDLIERAERLKEEDAAAAKEKEERAAARDAKKQAREQEKKDAAEARLHRECKGKGCEKFHQAKGAGKGWYTCECGKFAMCKECSKAQGEVRARHERTCLRDGKHKRRVRDPARDN